MDSLNFLLFILSFIGIWIGSGIAIQSVESLSHRLKISSFSVSFILLGFFTSISEISVGVNSIILKDPEIFVGNLIGASIVLFMFIIPLLAITGNSIRISPAYSGINLPISLVVISIPVLVSIDGVVNWFDGLIAVLSYVFLIFKIQHHDGLRQKIFELNPNGGLKVGKEIIKIIFGVIIIFFASKLVVSQTIYFSSLLNISPFLISLLLISVGTNIPELSLIFRSMASKNKQIAFGDYIGSATFNTFLIGLLTIVSSKPVVLLNSYLVSLSYLLIGLIAFYLFARSKNTLSRLEGFILLSLYISFLFTEFIIHY